MHVSHDVNPTNRIDINQFSPHTVSFGTYHSDLYTEDSPLSRAHLIAFLRWLNSQRRGWDRSRGGERIENSGRTDTHRNAHTYNGRNFRPTPVHPYRVAFEIEITDPGFIPRHSTASDLDYRRVPVIFFFFSRSFSPPPDRLSFFPVHPSALLARMREYAWVVWRAARTKFQSRKSCRPVHSSARPDVFTLERRVTICWSLSVVVFI